MTNAELYEIAKKHKGEGGAKARAYCGLGKDDAWCNAYVCYIANEGGVKKLYFNGTKYTYCPTSIKWCDANLAMIPPYLALPMDIVYFDWELNGIPNHIGFVKERKSATEVYTHEGNTSGGIVAEKTRSSKYILGIYRPHFAPAGLKEGLLEVDGLFGYNSIYMLQKVLGVSADGILGKDTVKALQKLVGVSQDGAWGVKTSKAVQKLVGATADGYFGADSVKALQKWINNKYVPAKKKYEGEFPNINVTSKNNDKCIKRMEAWAKEISADDSYKYRKWVESNKYTHQCPVCHPESNKHATKGWNCRGLVAAILYHGGNVKTVKCSCSGLGLLGKSLKDFTLANWKKANGSEWERIYNDGKNLKKSQLKNGDVIWYFNADKTARHVAFVYDINNGKIVDATSGKGISIRKPSAYGKIAFRYTGQMETIVSTKSIGKGDTRKSEVKKLQLFLIWAGYSVGKYGADGIFGDDTATALGKFQKDNRLAVDYLFGLASLAKAKEIER